MYCGNGGCDENRGDVLADQVVDAGDCVHPLNWNVARMGVVAGIQSAVPSSTCCAGGG
jgi:hypothetical protein